VVRNVVNSKVDAGVGELEDDSVDVSEQSAPGTVAEEARERV